MARSAQSDSEKRISDAQSVTEECDAVEEAISALRVDYEQYFLGFEKRAPEATHKALKKRLNALQRSFVRNTQLKFRIQGLVSRFVAYERMWTRTLGEIENGTYKRDLFKARLRSKPPEPQGKAPPPPPTEAQGGDLADALDAVLDAALSEAPQAMARVQVRPPSDAALAHAANAMMPGGAVAPVAEAARPPGKAPSVAPLVPPGAKPGGPPGMRAASPRPAGPGGDVLSDAKVKAIYDAYVVAKKRCQEDTSKITLDSVAASLRKQIPDLIEKHKAKSVEFKVVIRNGKALLTAVPKV
jgi:hypothetical protein